MNMENLPKLTKEDPYHIHKELLLKKLYRCVVLYLETHQRQKTPRRQLIGRARKVIRQFAR